MNSEPIYLRQHGSFGELTRTQGKQWFQDCADEAKKSGAIFCRFSVDDADNPKIALVEGWDHEVSDQGEIRWQLTESKVQEPTK